jgi:hypothetical protein
MRIKLILLIAAVAATATPAVAQGYGRNCAEARQSNQVGGAILGGLLGGIAGSNIAASGRRHDGTAVGAVLGGVLGASIGGSTRCAPPPVQSGPLPPPPGTYAPGYGYTDGPGYGGQYSQYPSDPGYSYGYGRDDRDDPYYEDRSSRRVYADGSRSYNRSDDYAGRDCDEAIQITRLPDGTEIRRPVEACRDAYYGDWRVTD